ncbi:hypothetical protein BD779DRAFT_1515221 [Infundibulicybe gibba]|nr:hypothetical protein BD779DRAFT_1515221 [Infundibulicybe gibba]
MESLNLNTLATSLPTAHQNAEKELLNNFKAAALSITTLYRSSRQTSKRAYNAGYAAACQDLLTMIQQGVSVGGVDPSGSGSSHDAEAMTIGKVMDWTEARLDAIKSREEEEDEEEEKEKEKERGRSAPVPASAAPKPEAKPAKSVTPSTSGPRPRENPISLPTPNSPRSHPTQLSAEPSSSSPPAIITSALRSTQRASKPKIQTRPDTSPLYPAVNYDDSNSTSHSPSHAFPEPPITIAAGAKRRHAMMMMLDSATPPVSIGDPSASVGSMAGGPNLQHSQNQNHNIIQASSEAMDVEEDSGRERKRVARR